MILRGTGLNFGNDPFATVGEGGDTEKEEAAEEGGFEGYRMKGRGEMGGGGEERGDQVDTDATGAGKARAH